jgi:hypothetical protein
MLQTEATSVYGRSHGNTSSKTSMHFYLGICPAEKPCRERWIKDVHAMLHNHGHRAPRRQTLMALSKQKNKIRKEQKFEKQDIFGGAGHT